MKPGITTTLLTHPLLHVSNQIRILTKEYRIALFYLLPRKRIIYINAQYKCYACTCVFVHVYMCMCIFCFHNRILFHRNKWFYDVILTFSKEYDRHIIHKSYALLVDTLQFYCATLFSVYYVIIIFNFHCS
jgi:hypothetical protein